MTNHNPCSVKECDSNATHRGYCNKHYNQRTQINFTNRTHGITSTYKKGCRCDPCKEANRVYEVDRKQRKKQNTDKHRASNFRTLKNHGLSGYNMGCRCDKCKDAHAIKMREFHEKKKTEHGISYTSVQRRRFKEEHGYYPQRRQSDVNGAVRLAVYERDNWVCQICGKPVLKRYIKGSHANASVDHIIPQSQQLIPDHSANNPRTTHYICNAIRGNRDISDRDVAKKASRYL